MELRHLRYFVAIADSGSFTGAARILSMSQPPLSTQIRDLENELGAALFDRSGRRAALSPAGKLFLPDARRILAQSDAAKTRLSDALAGRSGHIRLGYDPAMLGDKILKRLRRFLRKSDGLSLRLEAGPTGELLDNVSAGSLDAGLVCECPASLAMQCIPIRDEMILVALSRKHPFSERKDLTTTDLLGFRFLVAQDGRLDPWEESFFAFLRQAHIACEIFPSSPSISERLVEAALGQGACLCTLAIAERAGSEVACLHLGGGFTTARAVMVLNPGGGALAAPALIESLQAPQP